MPCFHGYSRAQPDGRARSQLRVLEEKDVLTQVLARVRHHRQAGAGFEQFHAQHTVHSTGERRL